MSVPCPPEGHKTSRDRFCSIHNGGIFKKNCQTHQTFTGTLRKRGTEAGRPCLASLLVLEIMDKDPSQSSALAGRLRLVPL